MISAKHHARLHQGGKNGPSRYHLWLCTSREVGMEISLLQMLRNAKHLDASEFMFEDLTQRAVLVPEQGDEIIFPCAHGTVEFE